MTLPQDTPRLRGAGFCVRLVDYTPGFRQPPHTHDETSITLVVAGSLRERVRRREVQARALSLVVKPAGTRHSDQVGPRGARTVLVQLLDEEGLVGAAGRLGPWRWLHCGAGLAPLLRLGRALLDCDGASDAEELVFELLGEIAALPTPCRGDIPHWVRRAREALHDLTPEGVRVRQLASTLGVHPVSLTRAFRRAYGVSVTGYRRHLRLRRAAEQVGGTDRSLSAIAHETGYSDHAHMCRDVRAGTGLTPSGLRRVARTRLCPV